MRHSRFVLALLALALAVGGIGSVEWQAQTGAYAFSLPRAHGGDEPHYLVLLHSILFDGNLDPRNEYSRAWQGGVEAGALVRGRPIAHHTYIVDVRTGESVPWYRAYQTWKPVRCHSPGCVPFSRDLRYSLPESGSREIPAHPPAFSLLLAASVAAFAPDPDEVERFAGVALLVVSVTTLFVTGFCARRLGLEVSWALGAAVVLGLASPWLVYTKSFYSETASGLALALGLWATLVGRFASAGLASGVAAAIKPNFVLIGAGWMLERLLSRDRRGLFLLTGSLVTAGLLLVFFNHWILGRVVIGGVTPFLVSEGLGSSVGTLFDVEHGLFPFAPWAILCVWALALGPRRLRIERTAYGQLAWPLALHFALLTVYGSIGGACFGPRLWVPMLPWLSVVAALGARASGPALRAGWALAVVLGALSAIPSALHYADVFNARPYHGLERMLGLG